MKNAAKQARFEIINSTQDLDDPQFHRRPYIGPLACVESKRAKVELARLWSDWYQGSRVSIHAMTPGLGGYALGLGFGTTFGDSDPTAGSHSRARR